MADFFPSDSTFPVFFRDLAWKTLNRHRKSRSRSSTEIQDRRKFSHGFPWDSPARFCTHKWFKSSKHLVELDLMSNRLEISPSLFTAPNFLFYCYIRIMLLFAFWSCLFLMGLK